MSEKEAIEEKILENYYRMGLDVKYQVSPTSVSLDFTEHEDSAMRRAYWYVEEEVLKMSATDTSLDSCLKSFATKLAWLSVKEWKYSIGMLLILTLTLLPIFIWIAGGSFILLTTISFIALISVPFVWYWAFNGTKFEEADIKYQMTETQVFVGEEEIEVYYNSLTVTRWSTWIWIVLLIPPEIFNLFLTLSFMRGI